MCITIFSNFKAMQPIFISYFWIRKVIILVLSFVACMKFRDRCFFLWTGSLTQAIRNFAKSLEGWLKAAMQGVPEEMIRTKVVSPANFSFCLS